MTIYSKAGQVARHNKALWIDLLFVLLIKLMVMRSVDASESEHTILKNSNKKRKLS